MKLVEIPSRGSGFGAERLRVEANGRLSESETVRLRWFYNEYPERYPFNPLFPQAGRRGGSRAPAHTGGPEEIIVPPPPIYPPPHEPPPIPPLSGPPPYEDPGGGSGKCFEPGGQIINSGFLNTNGAQTVVGASERLFGPAVVVQIGFFTFNMSASTTTKAFIKVASDNDTSGGVNTSGRRLSNANNVRDFHIFNDWQWLYPYIVIPEIEFHLKFIVVVEAALGVLNHQMVVCLKPK